MKKDLLVLKQVEKSHYDFSTYVSIHRWDSYYYQINETLQLSPKDILIVGVGDNIVKNILNQYVPIVKTIDIDCELEPDYVGSISDLGNVCKDNVDLILCCQVLEHLPLKMFDKCLHEISNKCNFCILSLPQIYWRYEFALRMKNKGNRWQYIQIRNNVNFEFDGEHYWEIGSKNASIVYIRNIIRKYFTILNDYTVEENPYHHFFILMKCIK